MYEITTKRADELHFDLNNPRMEEFGITTEMGLLKKLWSDMNVKELVMSILANGFFQSEPLYVIKEHEKWVVIEGNRRLAAVKSILNPDQVAGMASFSNQISDSIRESLQSSIPVVEMESRESAWRFIGFKHVKGAAKWDSYAKAKYIARVHRDYNVSISEIAEQIGDSQRTALRLYRGLSVLEQAEKLTEFSLDDIYYSRIYFSHLYTALDYEGYYSYLGLDNNSKADEIIISQDYKEHLENMMLWLFGSKKRDIEPVIKKQNPDLRNLSQVLLNPESVKVLLMTSDLNRAYDNSLDGNEVLRDLIVSAKVNIEDALAKCSVYDGKEDAIKSCLQMTIGAQRLFESMKLIYRQIEDPSSALSL